MADWVLFTKRTEEPKLRCLERRLTAAGIHHRRNGDSFHAPILEVPADRVDEAWHVLNAIGDDTPDDDPRFFEELGLDAADYGEDGDFDYDLLDFPVEDFLPEDDDPDNDEGLWHEGMRRWADPNR
jgi:hypothetical protein